MKHDEIKTLIDKAWKTMTKRGIYPMPHMAHCLGSLKVGNKVLVISDNEVRIDTIERELFPANKAGINEAIDAFISQIEDDQ